MSYRLLLRLMHVASPPVSGINEPWGHARSTHCRGARIRVPTIGSLTLDLRLCGAYDTDYTEAVGSKTSYVDVGTNRPWSR